MKFRKKSRPVHFGNTQAEDSKAQVWTEVLKDVKSNNDKKPTKKEDK